MGGQETRKTLLTLLLVVLVLGILSSSAGAGRINVSSTWYFGLPPYGTYINFNPATSFDSINRIGYTWYFDDVGITNSAVQNMTVTNLDPDTWINYTTSGAGQQNIYTPGHKPGFIFLDGVNCSEGSGWTHSGGWTIITGATSTVEMDFIDQPDIPPPGPEGDEGYVQALFPEGSSLRFQNDALEWVTVTMVSGDFNGSRCSVYFAQDGGYFNFLNNEAVTINATRVGESIIGVRVVDVETGRVFSLIETNVQLLPTRIYQIEWSRVSGYEWMPIMAFIGLAGIGMLVIGPPLTIVELKKKNWNWLVWGFLITLIGLGLTIGWLWG